MEAAAAAAEDLRRSIKRLSSGSSSTAVRGSRREETVVAGGGGGRRLGNWSSMAFQESFREDATAAGRSLAKWTSTAIRESMRNSAVGSSSSSSAVFFSRKRRGDGENDEEEDLKWAAIERLPTVYRARAGVMSKVLEDGSVVKQEVDLSKLRSESRKVFMDNILKVVEDDNERLLRRLRARVDRVGIELPTIEVRYENLMVETDSYVGKRRIPTLLNVLINIIEGILPVSTSKKRTVKMLHGVSGIIRPSRMTLLLGPPGSGKTTLLLALAGKLDKKLRVSGKVTFCGRELSEFIPQRTCAFISQHDLHHSEMTVREILDFSGCCLGVGTNYDMLLELLRREKHAGIKPDPEVDAFMKATSLAGQETSLVTDYILKMLGLDTCADVIVGNEMLRGISGGQRKRVTTGEMLVGPAKALFMDEISTGLDSSTTFQIVKFMRQMVHVMDGTIVISLLQPAPETFNLFDDVILLAEGQIVYQGPRDRIMEFFECIGFKCPERKGVADFLQEVTSRKDQEKYWFDKMQPYKYVSVPEFVQFFNAFHVGEKLMEDLKVPYDRFSVHPAALTMKKYSLTQGQVFKACLSREWLLMKRASVLYIFKAIQGILLSTILTTVFLKSRNNHETISGGGDYLGALFFVLMGMMFNGVAELGVMVHRLPMFYKQRDLLFYPAWAFALPICLLKIPVSVVESSIWVVISYYGIGFSPAPSRFFRQILAFACLNQTGYSIYRLIAAVARTDIIASTFGGFVMLAMFVLGGFIISKDDIPSSLAWIYYICPLSYAQNALAVNEFLDPRWGSPINDTALNVSTVGVALLKSRGLETNDNWYWISVGALVGLAVFFNVCFVAALTYLNPLGSSQQVTIDDDANAPKEPLISKYQVPGETEMNKAPTEPLSTGIEMEMSAGVSCIKSVTSSAHAPKRAMILPFQPHSLCFNHMSYYVDMPPEMKSRGINESRLKLLCDVSGVIRPGILTALVGVSGAGKTTLMDVLAGRKTGGYIEGVINVSGYPKCQETFARISGYCEQNDIHSPCVTVYESLIFSAWLRLDPDVHLEERKLFVEEVMDLVELDQLRDSLVGLPGVDGLSTEQRKRLTIAVELVANPSIIFMDEPTSGLDARAAAIVMRTVRNTVDTGRTVVCTIHQPSIDIFESFNELLLMKRGGQVIYAGPLGHHSQNIIKYFEAIPGIPKIKDGYNPATWMLEISSSSSEARLNVDFAEIYCNSSLYKENRELIEKFSTASPGSKDLYFPTKYSQSLATQCMACFWKQYWSYWRNPQYNLNRLGMTTLFGAMFGILFWNKGSNIVKLQDLFNLIGCMYSAILFLGSLNCSTVQTTVNVERTILYREKAAGMYSAMAYAFGQVSIEVLYVAVQSLVYGLILFFMLGFSWHTSKFLLFMYFMFMTFLNYTMFGMMAVALTPAPHFGLIIMSFVTSLWNLFSGFMMPRPVIPIWWRWYYWLSPMAWTLYGLVASQVGDKESLIEVPGQQPVPLKALLKDKFGYEYEFIKFAALAQLLFFSLFFFIFVYSIRNFNFQNR